MTTLSEKKHIEMALKLVAERRPDIEVFAAKGVRMGPTRLARITLRTGEYLQVAFPGIGSHGLSVADHIANAICGMRPKPRKQPEFAPCHCGLTTAPCTCKSQPKK